MCRCLLVVGGDGLELWAGIDVAVELVGGSWLVGVRCGGRGEGGDDWVGSFVIRARDQFLSLAEESPYNGSGTAGAKGCGGSNCREEVAAKEVTTESCGREGSSWRQECDEGPNWAGRECCGDGEIGDHRSHMISAD